MSDRRIANVLERVSLDDVAARPLIGDAARGDKLAALGYSQLQNVQRGQALISVLAERKKKPFTEKSVARYKKLRLKEAKSTLEQRIVRVCMILFPSSFVALFVIALTETSLGHAFFAAPFVVMTLVVMAGSCIVGEKVSDKVGTPYWATTPLALYQDPLPLRALDLVAELSERLPGIAFSVEHLATHPDPFLVAHYGDKQFYVDVWDEPSFTAEPIA
jgi:hypothetical protein